MKISRLNSIKILTILLIIFILITLYFQFFSPQKIMMRSYSKKLIKNLNKDNITSIIISDKSENFILEKKEDIWFVKIKDKYFPSKNQKIQNYTELLEKLTQGIIVDKGDKPDNDKKFGFDDERVQKVEVKTSNNTDFYIMVGTAGTSPGTSYIKLRDEKKIREVRSSIAAETNNSVSGWANKRVFSDDIKREDIEKIEVESYNFKWYKGKYTIKAVENKEENKDKDTSQTQKYEIIPAPNGEIKDYQKQNIVETILFLNAYDFKVEGELGNREKLGQIKLYLKNNSNFTMSFYNKDPNDIADYIISVDFNNYLYLVLEDSLKNFIKSPDDLVTKK
ncbi:MAG: DUF4340 domain-containing protein [Spirochaetes bacterium]|nr:DUF4340 domain-containing protein [Spirochaetota bacterium]